jgi:hypothetical protein
MAVPVGFKGSVRQGESAAVRFCTNVSRCSFFSAPEKQCARGGYAIGDRGSGEAQHRQLQPNEFAQITGKIAALAGNEKLALSVKANERG